MFKNLLYAAMLISTTSLMAQNSFEMELDSIQDEIQASKFIDSHRTNKGQIFVFNKEKHKTQLAQELFSMGKGGSKVVATEHDKTHYKIIDKYDIPYHRYSYVYLDGRNTSATDMHQLQQRIIAQYKEGYRFKDLANRYSMDASAKRGGDLGWFTKGSTSTELQDAILGKTNGQDIFTLNFPEKNAYYVVVRTHPTKFIEEIKVLQVSEAIR